MSARPALLPAVVRPHVLAAWTATPIPVAALDFARPSRFKPGGD